MGNSLKRAVTQAKRRVTLSICGLGWLDESEVDDIPAERIVPVNPQTGDVLQPRTGLPAQPPARTAAPAARPKASMAMPDMTDWWRRLIEAGWDAGTIQLAAEAAYGRQVQHLDGDQRNALHAAALSGRLQLSPEGEWRITPVGGDEAAEEGPTETV